MSLNERKYYGERTYLPNKLKKCLYVRYIMRTLEGRTGVIQLAAQNADIQTTRENRLVKKVTESRGQTVKIAANRETSKIS